MAYVSVIINDNFTPKLINKLGAEKPIIERALANEIMKDTTPFVPALNLSLSNRAQVQTGEYRHLFERVKVSKNTITYPGPYARYLYYGKVMVDRETGRGPMLIVGKDGSEKIRFRAGARLKPTTRNLKYSKVPHPQATDHWIEASKRKNMKKWEQFTGELITHALNNR